MTAETSYNKVQFSVFLTSNPNDRSAPQLVFRCDDVFQLSQMVSELTMEDEFSNSSPLQTINDAMASIRAAGTVMQTTTAPVDSGNEVAPQNPPIDAWAGNNAPSCSHGTMVHRSGVVKKTGPNFGRPYEADFCPAPMGQNQCKPKNFTWLN